MKDTKITNYANDNTPCMCRTDIDCEKQTNNYTTVYNKLKFGKHVNTLCKIASNKLNALMRISHYMPLLTSNLVICH